MLRNITSKNYNQKTLAALSRPEIRTIVDIVCFRSEFESMSLSDVSKQSNKCVKTIFVSVKCKLTLHFVGSWHVCGIQYFPFKFKADFNFDLYYDAQVIKIWVSYSTNSSYPWYKVGRLNKCSTVIISWRYCWK